MPGLARALASTLALLTILGLALTFTLALSPADVEASTPSPTLALPKLPECCRVIKRSRILREACFTTDLADLETLWGAVSAKRGCARFAARKRSVTSKAVLMCKLCNLPFAGGR